MDYIPTVFDTHTVTTQYEPTLQSGVKREAEGSDHLMETVSNPTDAMFKWDTDACFTLTVGLAKEIKSEPSDLPCGENHPCSMPCACVSSSLFMTCLFFQSVVGSFQSVEILFQPLVFSVLVSHKLVEFLDFRSVLLQQRSVGRDPKGTNSAEPDIQAEPGFAALALHFWSSTRVRDNAYHNNGKNICGLGGDSTTTDQLVLVDFLLHVRADSLVPVDFCGDQFVLLFLQDAVFLGQNFEFLLKA